jgi:hypothetical protein
VSDVRVLHLQERFGLESGNLESSPKCALMNHHLHVNKIAIKAKDLNVVCL